MAATDFGYLGVKIKPFFRKGHGLHTLAEDSKFPNGTPITGVWLMREGGENASDSYAVVYAEVNGQWFELIREHQDGNYSHCANVTAIRESAKPQWEHEA